MADAKKTMQIVIEAKNEAGATLEQVGAQAGGVKSSYTGLGFALSAVAVGFGALATKMVMSAGNFEQTRVAFTNMMGSAAQANQLLKDLADFALKTPFELKDLENGAKRLMAYGTAAADIIPQLGMLGTAASLTGVPINQLANAFGQVQVKGKLMGGEVLQFMNAGIPITRLLADSMGKSTMEISKMIETGKIGFNQLNKVMEENYGIASKNGKLMEEQSKTFLGRTSNLNDAWEKFLRTQGGGLIMFANIAVDKLAGILNWLNKDAEGFNYVGRTILGVINFFVMLWKAGQFVADIFVVIGATVIDLAGVMYAWIKDAYNNITNFGKQTKAVFTAMGQAITGDFAGAGETIKGMFTGVMSNTAVAMGKLAQNGKASSMLLVDGFNEAKDAVAKFASGDGFDKAKAEYGKLGVAAKKTGDEVGAGGKKASDEVKKMADKIGEYNEKAGKTFQDLSDAVGEAKTKIAEVLDKMQELMNKQATDQRDMRTSYAEAYVTQEQKVAELKTELDQKKTDITLKLNEKVNSDNIASHNQELQRMQDEQTKAQAEFDRQKKALDEKKTIEIAYVNEVNTARDNARLTDFERATKALEQKQIQMSLDYEQQRKKLEGELKMEVDKYNKLKEIQAEAEKEMKRNLARGEKASIDSINSEIKHWNTLAQAIARAKSGSTSSQISSASVDAKLNALGGAKAVNITITGNSFLDENAAKKVGNLLMNSLKNNVLLTQ